MVLELDYQMQDFVLTTAKKNIWFVPNSAYFQFSLNVEIGRYFAVCCTSKLAKRSSA